jgi:HlyD family secretion protein
MQTPAESSSPPSAFRDTSAQDQAVRPRSRWRAHRSLGLLVLAVLTGVTVMAITIWRLSGAHSSVSREGLSIATVQRGTFIRDISADGQVVAARSPMLYAAAPGNVTLKVHAGDNVDKDQVVAVIDSPDAVAKLAQEEATLQSLNIDWQRSQLEAEQKLAQLREALNRAEVDRKTAEREFERSRKAHELGSYSELQMLKAQDTLEKAEFALDHAQADFEAQPRQNRFDIESRKALLARQHSVVAELRRQVDGLQVRSPVSGQAGQIQVADGANVVKSAPLLTVIDLSALEVEIRMPEALARDVVPGKPAELEGAGRRWKGTVSGVSPEVLNGQVTTRVRFLDEKPVGLRQSQRLAVRILLDQRNNVLTVDRGTFMDREGGTVAYVVHDNIAERRPVRLGAASIQKVEIIAGLSAGEQIVIAGTDAFNGEQRVILSR